MRKMQIQVTKQRQGQDQRKGERVVVGNKAFVRSVNAIVPACKDCKNRALDAEKANGKCQDQRQIIKLFSVFHHYEGDQDHKLDFQRPGPGVVFEFRMQRGQRRDAQP